MTTGRQCVKSFEQGQKAQAGNYFTDGKILCLFGVRIAEHRQDGIYFSMGGYQTVTTSKCLNFLSGVGVSTRKGVTTMYNPFGARIEINSKEWYKVGNYTIEVKA